MGFVSDCSASRNTSSCDAGQVKCLICPINWSIISVSRYRAIRIDNRSCAVGLAASTRIRMRFAKAALPLRRRLPNKKLPAHRVMIKNKYLEIAQERASEKPPKPRLRLRLDGRWLIWGNFARWVHWFPPVGKKLRYGVWSTSRGSSVGNTNPFAFVV